MRIVQVTCRYHPHIGGVESLVKELNDKLVQKGHLVVVYTFDRNAVLRSKDYIDGVLVRRYKPIVGDPLYLPPAEFLKDIRNDPSTILHVHDIHSLLVLMVALFKRQDQKILLQPHYHRFARGLFRQVVFNIYKRFLNSLVFHRLSIIVVNSRYEKNAISQDFPQSRKIVLIPEGIAINKLKGFKWSPTRPKRILYAGSLLRYKNVDKLIQAFSLLVNTRRDGLRLVISGEGPEKEYLRKLANELGVNSYVEWKYGLTSQELFSEYAKAQVFVLLSPLESFSRVVHEALIIGVPTVVLNTGATAELVEDGLVLGVNSTHKEEVAHAISKALDIKRTEVPLGQLAALDMEQYSSDLIKIYKSLLKEDSPKTFS